MKMLVSINGNDCRALLDTGASENFMDFKFAQKLRLKIDRNKRTTITLANNDSSTQTRGEVIVKLQIKGEIYDRMVFNVMDNCLATAIVGYPVMEQHQSVTIPFKGKRKPMILRTDPKLKVLCLTEANLGSPSLFLGMDKNVKPVKSASRRYSEPEQDFIGVEVRRLLKEGIIQKSNSPWRAQIVAAKQTNKWRMCIDYSQTVNLYSQEDAYPMPRIDELVNSLAKYSYFSKFDLKSAYHQIPIRVEDRKFTAFEANRRLYEFKRAPSD